MTRSPKRQLIQTFAVPTLYASVAAALLSLWVFPAATTQFGLEDGPIENVSALLLLLASAFMVYRSVQLLRSGNNNRVVAYFGFIVAVAFFIFAGEEISWGQRILEIESNDFLLQHNWQGEMNFHNFHTDIFNIAFHFGAFLFLVVMPLYRDTTKQLLTRFRLSCLSRFIPPTWLAFPSFALLGMLDPRFVYVIEKPWAAALYLSILAVGLSLLGIQLIHAVRKKKLATAAKLTASLLLICLGLYVSYLQSVDTMPNTISEYKEFIVAFCLFVFALGWRGKDAS